MLNKLRLDSTKIYEQTIATYEISKMIVDFVKGRKHCLSIGSEQGDVEAWDDLVIEKDKDFFIHIQVKRQNTDFSSDNCIRDQITKGKRREQLKDLSSIDKSMKSLAEWLIIPSNNRNRKEFHLYLPASEVQLKKGLTVRHFKELVQQHYRPNVTTSTGLAQLASIDSSVKNCFDWLQSWCGYENLDHILKLLSVIKIYNVGFESDIESKTEDNLKEIFVSHQVKEIRNKILSFIHINSTFTGSISPRCIIYELESYLQSNISRWTQFEKQDNKWCISGINDVELINEIERPSQIIPKLWNGTLPQNLKINATINDHCAISDSLLRLIIHQSGNTNTHCVNSALIRSRIIDRVGTLGLEIDDLETLSIVENNENFSCEEVKRLSNNAENRNYSADMENTMHLATWERVSIRVDKLISEMENSDSITLQDQIELRWNNWKTRLNANTDDIRDLFMSIIHPAAEGENIKGVFRVGMRTAQLLADSIFDLLVVSVALDPNNNGNWTKISKNLNIVAIGLRYWSGDANRRRKVRAINEDGSIITGKETANVIIFSKVTSSPNEMIEDLISDSKNQEQNSIADGKLPDLIITSCRKFSELIEKGDINEISKYIKDQQRVSKSFDLINDKGII